MIWGAGSGGTLSVAYRKAGRDGKSFVRDAWIRQRFCGFQGGSHPQIRIFTQIRTLAVSPCPRVSRSLCRLFVYLCNLRNLWTILRSTLFRPDPGARRVDCLCRRRRKRLLLASSNRSVRHASLPAGSNLRLLERVHPQHGKQSHT